MDRFTSNQDQNDHPPIIYTYISPAEMPEIRHFCDICLRDGRMSLRQPGRGPTCFLGEITTRKTAGHLLNRVDDFLNKIDSRRIDSNHKSTCCNDRSITYATPSREHTRNSVANDRYFLQFFESSCTRTASSALCSVKATFNIKTLSSFKTNVLLPSKCKTLEGSSTLDSLSLRRAMLCLYV